MQFDFESDDSEISDTEETILKKSPEEQFLWACEKGSMELFTKLISKDANIVHIKDSDKYTPLHRASYSNQLSIMKMLLKAGASVNSRTIDGWTPLHCACSWNNHECASLLIDEQADVNAKTNSGQTPLHLASSGQMAKEAKETLTLLLLNSKIDLTIKNSNRETAKQIAQRCSPYSYLFDDKPDLNSLKSSEKS